MQNFTCTFIDIIISNTIESKGLYEAGAFLRIY